MSEATRSRLHWNRGRAARAVAWALAGYFAINLAVFAVVDIVRPELRDGEYGRRLESLRVRVAEAPHRPLVVVIGSSRVAMDVCPRAWEEVRPGGDSDPLIFNMARVGGGPLMNLMTLRRLHADGIRPAAVVLEYWPPLLREEGPFREDDRIDSDRLYNCDRPFVRSYLQAPERTERRMLAVRLSPVFEHRTVWMREAAPRWLPLEKRIDAAVRPLDPWGWLPGLDRVGFQQESRNSRLEHCEGIYRQQLAGLRIDPVADRAIREAIAFARENGIAVAFTYLPESNEFRSWYTPEAEKLGCDYLAGLCRELRVPLIDARSWLPDEELADGFHATRSGAEVFIRRFGPAVRGTFPALGGALDGGLGVRP